MTIFSQTRTVEYTGTGGVDTYPYPFKAVDPDHLVVVETDLVAAETTLTRGVDYTVTGVGNDDGGDVILSSNLTSGHTLDITRVVPYTQPTDLRAQGPFDPESHESVFDRLTMMIQQVSELAGGGGAGYVPETRLLVAGAGIVDPIGSLAADRTIAVDLAYQFAWTSSHSHASYVDFAAITTPANPASGRRLFVDSGTGELSVRTSGGATVSLEDTGGGGGGTPAPPTGEVGLTVVPGVLTTYMRSAAAPPLDQGIGPTWTGAHTFSEATDFLGGMASSVLQIYGEDTDEAVIRNPIATGGIRFDTNGQDRIYISPGAATAVGVNTETPGYTLDVAGNLHGNVIYKNYLILGTEDDYSAHYPLIDGTRGFTGVVVGVSPTANLHLATKAYVDAATTGEPTWTETSTGTPTWVESGNYYLPATVQTSAANGPVPSDEWWGGVTAQIAYGGYANVGDGDISTGMNTGTSAVGNARMITPPLPATDPTLDNRPTMRITGFTDGGPSSVLTRARIRINHSRTTGPPNTLVYQTIWYTNNGGVDWTLWVTSTPTQVTTTIDLDNVNLATFEIRVEMKILNASVEPPPLILNDDDDNSSGGSVYGADIRELTDSTPGTTTLHPTTITRRVAVGHDEADAQLHVESDTSGLDTLYVRQKNNTDLALLVTYGASDEECIEVGAGAVYLGEPSNTQVYLRSTSIIGYDPTWTYVGDHPTFALWSGPTDNWSGIGPYDRGCFDFVADLSGSASYMLRISSVAAINVLLFGIDSGGRITGSSLANTPVYRNVANTFTLNQYFDGPAHINGGLYIEVEEVSSTPWFAQTSTVRVVAKAGASVLNLPPISTINPYQEIRIFNLSGGSVSIAPNAADSIQGGTVGVAVTLTDGTAANFVNDSDIAPGNWWVM